MAFSDENKVMVEKNISFLLNSFIENKSFDYIIFSWVLHRQDLIDRLFSSLDEVVTLHHFSLTCDEGSLRRHMAEQNRIKDQIMRSIENISQYEMLNTQKIDVSHIQPSEVVKVIMSAIKE